MNNELEELYQQVLLEHSKRPRNFGDLAEQGAVHVHGDNPSCGDEIHLHVRFGKEGCVDEMKFTGQGCAISLASASLMTLKLKGKSRADALALARAFYELLTRPASASGDPRATTLPPGFGDLSAFTGVRKFPQRVKCAMLPWRAFEQALGGGATSGSEKVSTE
jgi:nitrogen fixation NifU-like protein